MCNIIISIFTASDIQIATITGRKHVLLKFFRKHEIGVGNYSHYLLYNTNAI